MIAAAAPSTTSLPSLGDTVAAIVPCLDEEVAIGGVVAALRAQKISTVIVVDGGSRDRTVARAVAAGARVVFEPRRGYGRAMQAGIAAVPPEAQILLFLDGDGSDRPEFIPALIAPILNEHIEFTHGSRVRGIREPGSMSLQQIVAGHLAGLLMRLFYGVRFTDMSPFRAIRRDTLSRLGMRETTYGWNLEMQMRVAAAGISAVEIAVGQKPRRGGVSKVSSNVPNGLKAVCTILLTFVRLAASLRRETIQLTLSQRD